MSTKDAHAAKSRSTKKPPKRSVIGCLKEAMRKIYASISARNRAYGTSRKVSVTIKKVNSADFGAWYRADDGKLFAFGRSNKEALDNWIKQWHEKKQIETDSKNSQGNRKNVRPRLLKKRLSKSKKEL